MKTAVVRLFTSPLLRWVLRGWTRRATPILMLHRFSESGDNGRTSPHSLAHALEAVRREGLEPLTLGDLAVAIHEGRVPPRSICFTVDDGYRDFKEIAHPVFARFDVPVTLFATAGFVDGTLWNWWDRVQYCAETTDFERIETVDALGRPILFGASVDWQSAVAHFVESCKVVDDADRLHAVAKLERELGVSVPERPVERYAAMDWDDVRNLAGNGVEFGAHTVSHPILSRVDPEVLRHELESSISMLKRATGREVRTFAYPNGREQDFSPAAVDHLKRMGIRAAATTVPGVVTRSTLDEDDAPYHLPRLSFPEQPLRQEAVVSGLEAAKIAWGWR